MNARDVMISPVITVSPATSVGEIAKKLLTHRISAVPRHYEALPDLREGAGDVGVQVLGIHHEAHQLRAAHKLLEQRQLASLVGSRCVKL